MCFKTRFLKWTLRCSSLIAHTLLAIKKDIKHWNHNFQDSYRPLESFYSQSEDWRGVRALKQICVFNSLLVSEIFWTCIKTIQSIKFKFQNEKKTYFLN